MKYEKKLKLIASKVFIFLRKGVNTGAYRKTQKHKCTNTHNVRAKFVMCKRLFTEKHIRAFAHKFSNLAYA